MTTFQVEDWFEVRSEVIRHWPEHYSEVYSDEDYAPDFDKYEAIAAAGNLMVVTARRDGELIGYVVALVHSHLHQRDVTWGFFDSYWLRRDVRGPRLFPRMVQATEDLMKERGVKRMFASERSDGRMFAWMGWQVAERIYIKEISP